MKESILHLPFQNTMPMSIPRPNESEFPEGQGWEMEKGVRKCICIPGGHVTLFSLFFFPLFCDLIENNCLNEYALLQLSRGRCNDDRQQHLSCARQCAKCFCDNSDYPFNNPMKSYYCAHSKDDGTEACKATCQSPRAGNHFEMIFECSSSQNNHHVTVLAT